MKTSPPPSAGTIETYSRILGAGLVGFVGMQIRESNRQARAAAYQASGISTAEFHRSFTPRMDRLATESKYLEAIKHWTLEDWETVERAYTADLRMLETILLQVEQGLLPADTTSRLGYHWGPILSNPAMACVWPELRTNLGPSVRKFIEDSTPETDRAPCQGRSPGVSRRDDRGSEEKRVKKQTAGAPSEDR